MKPICKIDHVDKTFKRGKHETEVLRDITLDDARRASTSRSSAIRAAASRRLLNIVAGLCRRDHGRRAAGGPRGRTSPGRTARSCSRTTPCCRGSRSTTTSGSRWTRCSPARSRAPSATTGRCTISISCR